MPRFRVNNPVSIPDRDRLRETFSGFPACHCGKGAGCFGENMCIECFRTKQKEEEKPRSKCYTIAPHAVASRPLQPWPRPSMPDTPDGPSRLALGPGDFEGLGREKFWDQSPEERAKALPVMVEDANINCAARVDVRYLGVVSENKAFAKGWLNELQRVGAYNKRDRKK